MRAMATEWRPRGDAAVRPTEFLRASAPPREPSSELPPRRSLPFRLLWWNQAFLEMLAPTMADVEHNLPRVSGDVRGIRVKRDALAGDLSPGRIGARGHWEKQVGERSSAALDLRRFEEFAQRELSNRLRTPRARVEVNSLGGFADVDVGEIKRKTSSMTDDVAKVVTMLVTVNAAAVMVMIALSFLGGVLALEGLEKLDGWMRRRDGRRAPKPIVEETA